MSYNYSPIVFGSESGLQVEVLLDSLKASMGSAFDPKEGSIIWIYLEAIARVFDGVLKQNERLANQSNPDKMIESIPRWEAILGLTPSPNATAIERRAAIKYKFSLLASPTHQVISDLLKNILGEDVFVKIINISQSEANKAVPGGGVVPGGETLDNDDWHSTVSHIPILVKKPDNMEIQDLYTTVGLIFQYLPGLMSSWTTYSYIMYNSNDECGFILDEENNLNWQFFCPGE